MNVREITDIEEMRAVESIQREVWSLDDREILPALWLKVSTDIGGLLLGAYRGPELTGFAYAVVGQRRAGVFLHSDMVGVRPPHRRQGVALALKLAQRETALARGLRAITWTFDPLRAPNASLNFRRLGAIGESYLQDYYGDTTSSLHRGIGTDRLWVTWQLDRPSVFDRLQGKTPEDSNLSTARFALRMSEDGDPERQDDDFSAERIAIEIPLAIDALLQDDLSLAQQWRTATRSAFTAALSNGYRVMDFQSTPTSGTYILEK